MLHNWSASSDDNHVTGEKGLAADERRCLVRQEEKMEVREVEKKSCKLLEVLLGRRLEYPGKSDCTAGLGVGSSARQGECLNLPLRKNGQPLA